jgi:hypothetical protein
MAGLKALLSRLNLLRKIRNRHRFAANRAQGLLAVEIRNTIGFGARLGWVLEMLAFCEDHDLAPFFRFTYPGSTTDYFSRFFSIRNRPQQAGTPAGFVSIYTIGELDLGKNYDQVLTIERAAGLMGKYLGIRQDIAEEVDHFCARHFSPQGVLGVHYRGTDKSAEAAPVSHEAVIQRIDAARGLLPPFERIFVSTDDAGFLRRIADSPLGDMVIFRQDSYRAEDDTPIHRSGRDMYDINRDALVNCLLLSRCDALVKTSSTLSSVSLLFNPSIPFLMLNRPFADYFPERELLKRSIQPPG